MRVFSALFPHQFPNEEKWCCGSTVAPKRFCHSSLCKTKFKLIHGISHLTAYTKKQLNNRKIETFLSFFLQICCHGDSLPFAWYAELLTPVPGKVAKNDDFIDKDCLLWRWLCKYDRERTRCPFNVQAPPTVGKFCAHKQDKISFCFSVRYANNGSRSGWTQKKTSAPKLMPSNCAAHRISFLSSLFPPFRHACLNTLMKLSSEFFEVSQQRAFFSLSLWL